MSCQEEGGRKPRLFIAPHVWWPISWVAHHSRFETTRSRKQGAGSAQLCTMMLFVSYHNRIGSIQWFHWLAASRSASMAGHRGVHMIHIRLGGAAKFILAAALTEDLGRADKAGAGPTSQYRMYFVYLKPSTPILEFTRKLVALHEERSVTICRILANRFHKC